MYEVNGFQFNTEEEAAVAKKEADGIKYLKAQTRMDDPDVVLKLYNKLLQKGVFTTPVGIAFLTELHDYLHTIPYIKDEDLKPIPVKKVLTPKEQEKAAKAVAKVNENDRKKARQQANANALANAKNINYKTRYHVALFFAIIFAIGILGMFTISYYSDDNINILNYENELINKYSYWENQLEEKERELNARQMQLDELESNGGAAAADTNTTIGSTENISE